MTNAVILRCYARHAATDALTEVSLSGLTDQRCGEVDEYEVQYVGPVSSGVPRDNALVDILIAGQRDLPELARLLWLHAAPEERTRQPIESFELALAGWWRDHDDSHLAFIARAEDARVVGMAWSALLTRVPRPGALARFSADLQSLFVVPEHRGNGIGSALVDTATKHAVGLGSSRVTVSSGRKAVPVYERLGFAPSPELLQRLS